MNTKWEQFSEAYRQADPALQRLVDSGKIPQFVGTLLINGDIDGSNKPQLVILTANHCLGVTSTEELTPALNEIGVSEAKQKEVSAKIVEFCTNPPAVSETEVASYLADIERLSETPNSRMTASTSEATSTAQATTIETLRQQAVTAWSQCLSAEANDAKAEQLATIKGLSEQVKELQQATSEVSAVADPAAYWHEIMNTNRGRMPHADESTLLKVKAAYTDPSTQEKQSIISEIKGNAAS